MEQVTISPENVAAIRRHGAAAYPRECCGFLLGHIKDGRKTINETRPVANERTDSAHNRYFISPEVYWEGEKAARKSGKDIVGVYHSHPDHPSQPSAYDREHALPRFSYIIVAVQQGTAQEINSFVLSDDYAKFLPEELNISA